MLIGAEQNTAQQVKRKSGVAIGIEELQSLAITLKAGLVELAEKMAPILITSPCAIPGCEKREKAPPGPSPNCEVARHLGELMDQFEDIQRFLRGILEGIDL